MEIQEQSQSPELGEWHWEWKGSTAFGVGYRKPERRKRQKWLSAWGFE